LLNNYCCQGEVVSCSGFGTWAHMWFEMGAEMAIWGREWE